MNCYLSLFTVAMVGASLMETKGQFTSGGSVLCVDFMLIA